MCRELKELVWFVEDVAMFIVALIVFLLLLTTVVIWLPIKYLLKEVNK